MNQAQRNQLFIDLHALREKGEGQIGADARNRMQGCINEHLTALENAGKYGAMAVFQKHSPADQLLIVLTLSGKD